jgi:hypothetical protein
MVHKYRRRYFLHSKETCLKDKEYGGTLHVYTRYTQGLTTRQNYHCHQLTLFVLYIYGLWHIIWNTKLSLSSINSLCFVYLWTMAYNLEY